jgi:transposase
MTYLYFIGIDISKDFFDVFLQEHPKKRQRFANNQKGFDEFIQSFQPLIAQSFCVLESTGGYEIALIKLLLEHKIAVHRATPAKSHHFMRSIRSFGKNDMIDAELLARYGKERHGELSIEKQCDSLQDELKSLNMRRNDLIQMRVMEKNRLKNPYYSKELHEINDHIEYLSQKIAEIEKKTADLIKNSQELSEKEEILCEIDGIGTRTAAQLLAEMPELGDLDRKSSASLAGCAPHPKDSGNSNGYRSTKGGRKGVKKALFFAAMGAVNKKNGELREYYQALIARGKKKIVALTAVMRKIIIIANAKLRDHKDRSSRSQQINPTKLFAA